MECFCFCLVVTFLCFQSRQNFISSFICCFSYSPIDRKVSAGEMMLWNIFWCNNMIATRGLGICGWYYQDCRVIMETPKWNCFDTAILFSHEIWMYYLQSRAQMVATTSGGLKFDAAILLYHLDWSVYIGLAASSWWSLHGSMSMMSMGIEM